MLEHGNIGMEPCPLAIDLTGGWTNPVADNFCWDHLQLFSRGGCDYWGAITSGACLASNCSYVALRYDGFWLHGTPSARRRSRLALPRLVLALPGRPPLLLTLRDVQYAVRAGWRRERCWLEPELAHEHFASTTPLTSGAMVLSHPGLDAALKVWRLPHSVHPGHRCCWVRPWQLQAKDASEARAAALTREAAGLLLLEDHGHPEAPPSRENSE